MMININEIDENTIHKVPQKMSDKFFATEKVNMELGILVNQEADLEAPLVLAGLAEDAQEFIESLDVLDRMSISFNNFNLSEDYLKRI